MLARHAAVFQLHAKLIYRNTTAHTPRQSNCCFSNDSNDTHEAFDLVYYMQIMKRHCFREL